MSDRTEAPNEVWIGLRGVNTHKADIRDTLYRRADLAAPDATLAAAAMQRAAADVVRPKGKRPCDCYGCYCQNIGDAEAAATWDAENLAADAIMRLPLPADPLQAALAAPEVRAALSDGVDALTHALYLLPDDCNQRLGLEGALRRMAALDALRAATKEVG